MDPSSVSETIWCANRKQYDSVYSRYEEVRHELDQIAEQGAETLSFRLRSFAPLSGQDLRRYVGWLRPFISAGSHRNILLDAGAGLGGLAWWLSENVPCEAVALDHSSVACHVGRRTFSSADRARYVVGDLHAVPLRQNTVWAVVSIDALHLVGDKGRVLREVARVLRPGGPLIFSVLSASGESHETGARCWRALLDKAAFAVLEARDTTESWRREMRRRH